MKGFGIDFGTTNSVVAMCGETTLPRPLLDRDTAAPTPSVVWYSPEGVRVGVEARRNINQFGSVPGNKFFRSIKRELGQRNPLSVLGEPRQPWEIAAEIFRHLRNQSFAEYEEQVDEAVVTVPVTFAGKARRDLRQAAQRAGIGVVTFVHEPFAAVIGHLFREHSADGTTLAEPDQVLASLEKRTYLVFDWGGGTLDVTLVRVDKGKVWEAGVKGLADRAGDLFDEHIERYAVNRFIKKSGLHPDVVKPVPGIRDKLLFEAEQRKKELSSGYDTEVNLLDFIQRDGHSYDLSEPLERATFETLIEADVAAAVACVEDVLAQANVIRDEVTEVLLIGGTSRIPRVSNEIRRQFGARTVVVDHADTIIAEGASLVARFGWKPFLVRPLKVRLSDGGYLTVLEHETVLSSDTAYRELHFFCTDNRDGEAHLVLAEQHDLASDASETKRVLSIPVAPFIPGKFFPERVTVRFSIDDDVVLRVQGKGATRPDEESASAEIDDLCFGLKLS